MNELLTRSIEEGEVGYLSEMPRELMTERETETVSFVLDYTRKHGKTPSLHLIMETFETFIPFKFSASVFESEAPPLSRVFEEAIQNKLLRATERKLRVVKETMADSGIVPLEELAEIEKLHTLTLGVSRYSTFDRDLYFRRLAMNIPFKLINAHIGGISNGDFMLIIGRLGTGKSTIAQHIAKAIWLEGKRILFISAEMLGLDVFSRIDAMVGRFNPLELRKGKTPLMADVLEKVHAKVAGEEGEIIIPKSRLMSPQQIAAFAKNLDVDLIIVDGAYLLQPSEGRFTSKWEKVATVSNELKQIALELDLPLIATAQIKRGASGEDGYTPEDIALSDALGQDSDFVLAVFPNPTEKEELELQLIKNRYGSNCATKVRIEFETMSVIDESFKPTVKEEIEDWRDWVR